MGLLGTIISRGGVAVGPGVISIGRTGGSRVVKVWRRVGGRVVVTRVHGTISRWMRTAEEGGFGHPAMVDGGIWGRIESGGRVPLVRGVPELVVGRAHWLRQIYRI